MIIRKIASSLFAELEKSWQKTSSCTIGFRKSLQKQFYTTYATSPKILVFP